MNLCKVPSNHLVGHASVGPRQIILPGQVLIKRLIQIQSSGPSLEIEGLSRHHAAVSIGMRDLSVVPT